MKGERITLPIYNLGCGGGGALAIERALTNAPGVLQAYVNPLTEMAYIVYDPPAANPEQLAAVIDRIGYGAPRPKTRIDQAVAFVQIPPNPWDGRRMALLVGSLLAAIYILGVVLDLLFPNQLQLHRLWEALLIGVRWAKPWTMLLGLMEAFLLGALGAWGITAIYRAFPHRLTR
jgi:cation transport ATPase